MRSDFASSAASSSPTVPTFVGHREAARSYCLTPSQRVAKRALDITGCLFFFLCFGPMYIAVALAVRLCMGGPVHYWQNRIGQGGRIFRFYKFRSMVVNADEILAQHLAADPAARDEWKEFQKLAKDPRITPLGRVMRKFSIDELPQFFNVLKGDMSLVGPRPCMTRQRTLYGPHWGSYCKMRPGLTGLWQVSGRNRLSYAARVELDMAYASQWSLWLDIKILARTAWVVLRSDGSS
jgi:lipopolysaccharide/colanic/teichoic acid biosynthesis glycosyltransferase